MTMHASALQIALGLYGLSLEVRTGAEAILAAVAAMLAVALRHRRRHFSVPCVMISLGLLVDLLARLLAGPPHVQRYTHAIALIIFLFGLIRLILEAVDQATRRRRAHFSTIFKDLLTILLYSIVVMAVLRGALAFDVTPLLATSAVVTVVVGLGLQETFGNVFSGLTMQLQKPFLPGDWVRFGNHEGRVQGIGWRATRLVTRANERVEIPNSLLAKDALVNYAAGAVADDLFIGLSYSEPPGRVKEVITRVLHDVPGVLQQPPPEVNLLEYGDSAIRYRIRYWLSDWGVREIVHDAVFSGLWYALRRSEMEIPYPIRTLHMYRGRPEQELDSRSARAIDELRQADFLGALSDEELLSLLQSVRVHQFGAGELLMREGEPGDCFYILRRGTVEVLAKGTSAAPLHIRDLSPPAFFGEIALMTGEPRNATIRALTEVEALQIDRQAFSQLFKTHPEVVERIGDIIAARLSETRERVAAAHAQVGRSAISHSLLSKMRIIFDL